MQHQNVKRSVRSGFLLLAMHAPGSTRVDQNLQANTQTLAGDQATTGRFHLQPALADFRRATLADIAAKLKLDWQMAIVGDDKVLSVRFVKANHLKIDVRLLHSYL